MSSGSLLLSNSGYLQNQARFYSDLLESQELIDVTLACDGYQVGAHRTVISASSLFFRDVIKNSKHQNPFIYLKGVSKDTLDSMLKFIYAGEATVLTENLERLIEVGNDLRVIGLMEDEIYNTENLEKNNSIKKPKKEKTVKITKAGKPNTDSIENKIIFEKTNSPKPKMEKSDINSDGLQMEINKILTKRQDEQKGTVHVCTVCDKEGKSKEKIRLHIETHLEGFSHKCNYCDVVKKTRGSLSFHEWRYHTAPNSKITQTN